MQSAARRRHAASGVASASAASPIEANSGRLAAACAPGRSAQPRGVAGTRSCSRSAAWTTSAVGRIARQQPRQEEPKRSGEPGLAQRSAAGGPASAASPPRHDAPRSHANAAPELSLAAPQQPASAVEAWQHEPISQGGQCRRGLRADASESRQSRRAKGRMPTTNLDHHRRPDLRNAPISRRSRVVRHAFSAHPGQAGPPLPRPRERHSNQHLMRGWSPRPRSARRASARPLSGLPEIESPGSGPRRPPRLALARHGSAEKRSPAILPGQPLVPRRSAGGLPREAHAAAIPSGGLPTAPAARSNPCPRSPSSSSSMPPPTPRS